MNSNMLEAEMKLNGDTGGDVAEYLGISRQTFSNKKNENGAEFTQGEIAKMAVKYSWDAEKITAIFFTDTVSK